MVLAITLKFVVQPLADMSWATPRSEMQTCVHAFDGKVLVLDGLHDIHGKD